MRGDAGGALQMRFVHPEIIVVQEVTYRPAA